VNHDLRKADHAIARSKHFPKTVRSADHSYTGGCQADIATSEDAEKDRENVQRCYVVTYGEPDSCNDDEARSYHATHSVVMSVSISHEAAAVATEDRSASPSYSRSYQSKSVLTH
jgi:hypothetical protein